MADYDDVCGGAELDTPILTSPSGTISDITPTYIWQGVSNAEEYQLWVQDSSDNAVFDHWYTASEVTAGGGTCEVTPTTELASGDYTWWVRTYNEESGTGDWSEAMDFTVNISGTRFIDNGDGTVTDAETGLVWLQDPDCFDAQSLSDAENSCETLNNGECGLTDGSVEGEWRLPTLAELQKLGTDPPTAWEYYCDGCDSSSDYGLPPEEVTSYGFYHADEYQKTFVYLDHKGNFWSGTQGTKRSQNPDYHWTINSYNGHIYPYANEVASFHVWPVRSGN